MRRKFKFAAVALIIAALGSVSASANPIYDNISSVGSLGADLGDSFGPLFDSFSTGSDITLTNIELLLSTLTQPIADPSGTFTVSLYKSDATPAPTDLIVQIAPTQFANSLSDTPTAISFGSLSISLTPGRYWIGLDAADSTVLWSFASDDSGPGVAGEFFINANGLNTNDIGPYQMRLTAGEVTAVPLHPSIVVQFIGLGLLGLLGWRTQATSYRRLMVARRALSLTLAHGSYLQLPEGVWFFGGSW